MTVPNNFCGLVKDFSSYENSKAVILPVPYDKTRTWCIGEEWKKTDASKGPAAIIDASRNMELYDIELDKNIAEKLGIHTLDELKAKEYPKDMVKSVFNSVKKIIKDNKFPVVLGGEHSISLGAVKALKEKYNDLSCLQIDAHADLRDSYEGSKYSHACVMSRVRELCNNVVQVGIRSMSDEEADLINDKNIKIFFAKDIFNNDDWFDTAISMLSSNVYVTFDLDGLDISVMPSTGTPEPGGLLYYQVLRFLKKVCEKKNIVGFDIVELAPIKGTIAPDFLAAKLVYKLIGYSLLK